MSIQYTSEQLQRKFKGAPGSAGFARIAEVLRAEGRLEEAVALCQQGLAEKPGNITGHIVLGKCLVDMERLEEARDRFEAVLRLDPRCLAALHWLARIMTRLQWPDAAAAYYRSILEIEPWDMEALARFREAGAGAASPAASDFAPAPGSAAPAAIGISALEEAGLAPADLDGPSGVEEFPLDKAGDFLPGDSGPADLVGALQEVNLADALEAPPKEPNPFLGATPLDLAEPRPMDVLTEAPVPAAETEAPAPISGDDVEARLDTLFGASDDAPMVAHDPAEAGALDEATLQLAARRTQERPVLPAEPAPAEESSSPMETAVFDGADLLAHEKRVSGEDIEQRLDDLFTLSEGTRTRPVEAEPPAFLEAVEETVPEDAAPDGPAAYPAVVEAAESPAEAPEALTDLVLAPEPDSAAEPAAGDEVVTGQDVADKLEALFGNEPAPASGDLPASGSASWAVARPAADEAPAAEPRAAGVPEALAPFDPDRMEDRAAYSPGSDILSTESMLPRDLGRDAAPAITGEDIEERLDSLFSLEDAAAARAPEPEAVLADSPLPETLPEVTSVEPPADDASGPGAGDLDRTVMMPAMRETAGDWLARRADDASEGAGAAENRSGTSAMPAYTGDLGADMGSDTLILPMPDGGEAGTPFAATAPDADAGPFAGSGDTVGLEMVEGSDIADRLDEIFSGQDRAPAGTGPAASGQAREAEAREAALAAAGEASRWTAVNPPEPPEADVSDIDLSAADGPAAGLEAPADEVVLFAEDPAVTLPSLEPELAEPALADPVVSGEDISSRLSEIFENPPGEVAPSTGAETTSQPLVDEEPAPEAEPGTLDAVPLSMQDEGSGAPGDRQPEPAAVSRSEPPTTRPSATPLTQMLDDEEGSPEEEDAPQSAAGANVATVTLAEIYFQQGLREQALQIYRQLLEREPGNDSVRKRIQEIEASKPETGGPGQGQDPRRPRPGLKVPKRKK